MKKEGIIEFKSFEEIAKSIRQNTETKQQLLNERIQEILFGNLSKRSRYENEETLIINPNINVNFQKEKEIISKIHEHRKEIYEIKEIISNKRIGIENMFYRFYHPSFKMYELQTVTERMVKLFCDIGKCRFHELNPFYMEIVSEGINKKFDRSHNIRWSYETRPILESFFHSYHLLEMMTKYDLEMDSGDPPLGLNEGWASVLYLYNIR